MKSSENARTILYIAGYGRSGSTLLERILSSNERIFGTGELSRLPDFLNYRSWTCSCGDEIGDCDFWGEVIKGLEKMEYSSKTWKRIRNKHESFASFYHFFTRRLGSEREPYIDIMKQLFETIFQHLPEETDYVVDSSKTARKSFFRPLVLSRFVGLEVKVIHLVRDGRGCMWSNLKGSNRKMERGEDPNLPFAALRTAISWPLANTGAQLFAHFAESENYLRVKYEDFVNDPDRSLNRIGKFINLDLEPQVEMLKNQEPIPKSHQLAGNRMRKKKSIVLQEDLEWKDSLSRSQNLLFWLLDWPWALKYDYG